MTGPALRAPTIRHVTTDDAEAVAAIYAPYVTDTPISFETAAPTPDAIRERIARYAATHPWLVDEVDGRVLGYAYATRHHERAAYDWSCEVSVYVDRSVHRHGIGSALYEALLRALKRLGYYNALAGITEPNPASIGLHEAMGFRRAGVNRNVGYKDGRWWDVAYYEASLQDAYPTTVNTRPRPMDELSPGERDALLAADGPDG
jgi:L-amino acid N-acyltransferase YncA